MMQKAGLEYRPAISVGQRTMCRGAEPDTPTCYNVTPIVWTGVKERILALEVLRQLLSRILWYVQNM